MAHGGHCHRVWRQSHIEESQKGVIEKETLSVIGIPVIYFSVDVLKASVLIGENVPDWET